MRRSAEQRSTFMARAACLIPRATPRRLTCWQHRTGLRRFQGWWQCSRPTMRMPLPGTDWPHVNQLLDSAGHCITDTYLNQAVELGKVLVL